MKKLLIGGSPCQGFSFAGKQLNFDDPRSKLFFEFVRILKEYKPDYFLLENVRMKKWCIDTITEYLGVEPIRINSNLLSAQKRDRFYWTNIKGIELPIDKNILLKDIIINGFVDKDKSYCIDANYFKGTNLKQYREKCRRQVVYLSENEIKRANEKYKGKIWKPGNRMGNMKFPDDIDKKSKCLTATIIKGARETVHIKDISGIRILTPIECERLQTVPENYTNHVSNTQRYKMLGNGWTVDVIAHIFNNLPNEDFEVLSLFDGMSCGQIAMERAGKKVVRYMASEIDKYAIKVTQANYPNTIQLGDVRGVCFETSQMNFF